MKKLFGIVVLSLFLIMPSHSDDIRDFQIEGISIGDSLLDYMTIEEIKQNTLNYFQDERNYYVVAMIDNLNQYDQIELYLKSNDRKYEIKTMGGFVTVNDLDECFKLQDEIDNEFKDIFSNLKIYSSTLNHIYDKSGKSKQYQTNYVFGSSADKDDHIRTECTDWSAEIQQKEGYGYNLTVVVMTKEILKWVHAGYKP